MMPFVFKVSALLLALALVAGQAWQLQAAAKGANTAAAKVRAGCPAMQGPAKVATNGDEVRFYDAYIRRVVSGLVGLSGGCAAR